MNTVKDINERLKDKKKRRDTIKKLREIGDESSIKLLIEVILDDERWAIQREAIIAIGRIGKLSKDDICDLTEILKEADKLEVQQALVDTLGKISLYPEIVLPVFRMLLEYDNEIKYTIPFALQNFGEMAIPMFIEILSSEDIILCKNTVNSLSNMETNIQNEIKDIIEDRIKDEEYKSQKEKYKIALSLIKENKEKQIKSNQVEDKSLNGTLKKRKVKKHINQIKIGIITVLDEEWDAINEYFDLKPDKEAFHSGKISRSINQNGEEIKIIYEITHIKAGKGSESRNETDNLFNIKKPNYTFLVGIAGGIGKHDVKIGDILIPDEIFYYEFESLKQGKKNTPKIENTEVTNYLLKVITNYYKNPSKEQSWFSTGNNKIVMSEEQLKLLGLKNNESDSPHVIFGKYLCGEKVVHDPDKADSILEEIPNHKQEKCIGIEMESFHVIETAKKKKVVPQIIVIKCCSDDVYRPDNDNLLEEEKKWDKFHILAANRAAKILHHFLLNGTLIE